MADDVTLEDLQKIWKRLEVLEAAAKELARLQKIQDTFDTDMTKNMGDHIKSNQTDIGKLDDQIGKLDKRVTELEKKVKK